MQLRLASWNVNSVRLRAEQVARFVHEAAPDVLCLQEIKCREGEFPTAAFVDAGLRFLLHAGFPGVGPTNDIPEYAYEGGHLMRSVWHDVSEMASRPPKA